MVTGVKNLGEDFVFSKTYIHTLPGGLRTWWTKLWNPIVQDVEIRARDDAGQEFPVLDGLFLQQTHEAHE